MTYTSHQTKKWHATDLCLWFVTVPQLTYRHSVCRRMDINTSCCGKPFQMARSVQQYIGLVSVAGLNSLMERRRHLIQRNDFWIRGWGRSLLLKLRNSLRATLSDLQDLQNCHNNKGRIPFLARLNPSTTLPALNRCILKKEVFIRKAVNYRIRIRNGMLPRRWETQDQDQKYSRKKFHEPAVTERKGNVSWMGSSLTQIRNQGTVYSCPSG